MKNFLLFSLALLLCGCQRVDSFWKDCFWRYENPYPEEKNSFAFLLCNFHNVFQKKGETTYPKEKIVNNDRFDFSELKKLRTKEFFEQKKKLNEERKDAYMVIGNKDNFQSVHKILPDGTSIEILPNDGDNVINLSGGNYFPGKNYPQVVIIPPPPALFKMIKTYYPDGTIFRITSHRFIGQVDEYSGITQTYDRNGVLEKTVDYDKRQDGIINIDTLLQILIRNKLLNPYSKDNRESSLSLNKDKMIWYADISGRTITIDARIGKILSNEPTEYID